MDAYDSSGRRISLLSNDDEEYSFTNTPYAPRKSRNAASSSSAYPPDTPELTRSHSFGSQSTHNPQTPVMPDMFFHRRTSDDSQQECESPMSDVMTASQLQDLEALGQPSHLSHHTASSAPGRRKFPCRLAKEFNCEKTFTTSGHASRHAKIHSQHKHIRCTYDGCTKTFTRTDNMKQHLETHFRDKSGRDKSRRSTSRRRSDGSVRSHRRSSSIMSHGSPYPVFADVEYQAPELAQRASFDRRSSGTGMDILAIAAEQVGAVHS
ncbi:conidial septation protein [Ophiostoma piceae UAMH 11346]|uniref:Conidial septation protein n=1 Tax=Ophiostoma piceae (strain UAMH 11346) TaxID=1262450 RepID=S3C8P9_OPHP1|nr:conidial septation protein [Ophiostoma piceae UAMH 11346]